MVETLEESLDYWKAAAQRSSSTLSRIGIQVRKWRECCGPCRMFADALEKVWSVEQSEKKGS